LFAVSCAPVRAPFRGGRSVRRCAISWLISGATRSNAAHAAVRNTRPQKARQFGVVPRGEVGNHGGPEFAAVAVGPTAGRAPVPERRPAGRRLLRRGEPGRCQNLKHYEVSRELMAVCISFAPKRPPML
jgi:hypothetical protein